METTPKTSFEGIPLQQIDREEAEEFVHNTGGGKEEYRKKRLVWAILLCFLLFILQIIGGFISNSLALLADAFHMLSDMMGYALSLTAITMAASPRTSSMPFGKRRLEVLGALASISLLWILSLGLVMEAFDRLANPKAINGQAMLFMAAAGVFVNSVLILIFGHDDEDHTYTDIEATSSVLDNRHDADESRKDFQSVPLKAAADDLYPFFTSYDKSSDPSLPHKVHTKTDLNIRAAMLHAIGDLLCSVGVFISALVIVFNPTWLWIDPLCTFVFAIVALGTTFPVLLDIFSVLMEGAPVDFSIDGTRRQILAIYGVVSVEDIKVWQLTQKDLIASVKISVSVSRPAQIQKIVDIVRGDILRKRGVFESTIETSICASDI